MSHLYPDIVVDNKAACDVCHYAKQKKLPFHNSSSHANTRLNCYILIYGDLCPLHLSIITDIF
jgi:hypothetical protein